MLALVALVGAQQTCDAVVQNQGECGSCYSFASTEMIAARTVQTSLGSSLCSFGGVLSAEVPVAFWNLGGCQGGMPASLGQVAQGRGVPTAQCAAYVSGSCPEQSGDAPSGCTSGWGYQEGTCYSDPSLAWQYWGHYAGAQITGVSSFAGAEAFLQELSNGPFVAVFAVYDNFYSYSGGVYQEISGAKSGYHAVLVTGYGTDGVDYWTVRNSWGASWGEAGYFRILRGYNLAEFEAGGVAFAVGTQQLVASAPAEPKAAGGWMEQPVAAASVAAAKRALEEANGQSYVHAAATQVVSGLNVQLQVTMESLGPRPVQALLHRPVQSPSALLAAEPAQWRIVSIQDLPGEALVV